MKKLTSLFVILALLMLCACGSKEPAAPEKQGDAWVNPQFNEYTLTKLRMVGKGDESSGYKVAFFPPETLDGAEGFLVFYSVREFDEVWEYLSSLTSEEILALAKPANRAYVMTDLSYCDGVGNTLNTAQKDLITGDDFTEPGTHYFYAAVFGADGLLSLEKAAQKLMAFTVMIEECAELLQKLPLPDFYEEVMTRTGYLQMLEEKGDVESRTRAENVRELKSSILSYMENTETPTLAGFLEEIALYTDIEQYDPDADAVVMMTMHAAKGLEFPNVFLVGLEEGLFPSNRCMSEPEELEEERRLCYVAITRAKQHLVITYARQRMLYGRTTTNLPSRFVDELPAESVKRIGAPKPSYQQTEPRQYGSFGRVSIYGDSYNDFSQIPTRPKPQKDYSVHTAPKPAPKVSFAAGEMVQHKAFGRGMILTVLPMGNDALLEIAFDGVGTKRLMANTAAQHMKKL